MKKKLIWGAGFFGQKMYAQFKNNNEEIEAVIDNYSSNMDNVRIIKPEDMVNNVIYENCEIYICIRNYYSIGNVIRQLHNLNINEAYVVCPEVYNMSEIDIEELKKSNLIYHLNFNHKAVISKLEFHVIDRCNLNCVGCSHFAPIFEDGRVEIEDFEKQMQLVSDCFENVLRFRLMGGEPFLHESIGDFSLVARTYLPYSHLEIVTNGLLINTVSKDNWDKIKKSGAILNISLYPPTYAIKEKIAQKLSEEGINFLFGSGLEQYNDTGIIEEFHKCFTYCKSHDPEKAAKNCVGNYCHYLRDGKISKCALPQLVYIVNNEFEKKFEVVKEDVFDLKEISNPWEMVEQLSRYTPFCGYCTENYLERFKWKVDNKHRFEDYITEE